MTEISDGDECKEVQCNMMTRLGCDEECVT